MNHVPYEIAQMQGDDLLRAAAKRRLGTRLDPSVDGGSSANPARRQWQPRRRWQRRFTALTRTGQTRERTLDGRL